MRAKKAPAFLAGAFRSRRKLRGINPIYAPLRALRSVAGDERAAEAIVDSGGEEIDVLTDAFGVEQRADRSGQVVAVGAQEDVVVLETSRPVRREAVLETNTDDSAP